tara:strand:- start:221 stop:613 length:393 start_codon:yes stop_codon:yes gene_type:complete
MKEDIIKVITRFGDISLNALKRKIKDSSGEFIWDLKNSDGSTKNVIVIADVNEKFIRSVTELINDDVINIKPCSPMIVYFDGGEVYNYEIAKPGKTYKKTRWLPMVVDLTESKIKEIINQIQNNEVKRNN